MKLLKIWSKSLKDNKTLLLVYSGGIWVFVSLTSIRWFLVFNESRRGFVFDDPILKLLTPHDLTWPIFFLIHFFLLWGLYIILHNVKGAIIWAHAYSIMILIRIVCLYLLPLEPPIDMIYLQDPVVATFTSTATPVRDLFFSGHTATSFLIYLGVRGHRFAPLFLCASIMIGICVLIQHVHYSIDVLAAPFFAYGAYKISQTVFQK